MPPDWRRRRISRVGNVAARRSVARTSASCSGAAQTPRASCRPAGFAACAFALDRFRICFSIDVRGMILGSASPLAGSLARPLRREFCARTGPRLAAPPGRGLSVPPEGAERREAHLTSALRRRALGEGRSPFGAPPRFSPTSFRRGLSSGPGFRGPGIGARLVQQAPCRAVLMPPDRGPGAARGAGYEPCPRGPPLLHPPNVSGRRPSASRVMGI